MVRTVRDLGAAVRSARRAAGLTQQAVAERADVSRQWLSRLENGSNPGAELRKVLDVLGVLGVEVQLTSAQRVDTSSDPFADLFARPS